MFPAAAEDLRQDPLEKARPRRRAIVLFHQSAGAGALFDYTYGAFKAIEYTLD